jgi:hypothetical protein
MPNHKGDDPDEHKGNGNVGGAGDDAALDDQGAPIVADIISLFLRDLAAVPSGAVEELRVRTERAGELLRRHGHDRRRAQQVLAYRLKLRRARQLVDRMFEVVEADLPPA